MAKKEKSKGSAIPKPLAERLKGILETPAPDFDPEENLFETGPADDDSESDNSDDSEAAREHYLQVGESKMRKQQSLQIADDPKYRGVRVSRSALYQNSDAEEPIDESDDEDALETNDAEASASASEDSEVNSSDEESDFNGALSHTVDNDDAELAAELQQAEEEEKALLASLTQKATSDAVKGQHVKNQLSLWETTLDLNIRFHKLATLANPLPQKPIEGISEEEASENAQLVASVSKQLTRLIGSALEFRKALWPADNPELGAYPELTKRPREEQVDVDELWKQISSVSESYKLYCHATIEKWSNRVRMTEGISGPGKKFKALDQSTLHQIQATLADSSRLVRRSQLKRTAFNLIGKENSKTEDNYDTEIYDDTDFYQQLLREFIDSRMVDNDSQSEMGIMRWAALKQDKQRKNKVVDTKASKGRKLRYHVHESLQSFMAPVDVQQWHSEMVDELYASLFQRQTQAAKSDIPNDGLRIFG
ncbi:rRNA-processing protein bfr2, variant 3 [Entomophthora muscae]|uniref:rRNA-processing protein bfr2, variant 3 n=1 Tax=Entomophthora muscae TaxID=34485 RepID=A0ACC2RX83_9FUNG|nr:rRNA-processing protein bfr2, variant 3 [Entomophthora muscae]